MYLKWDEKIITDFSDINITALYNQGYVFTRVAKGVMDQTRSVRIDLSTFELSSENRRVLRKTEGVLLKDHSLPLPLLGEGHGMGYHWSIGKLAKDFYDTKFGDGTLAQHRSGATGAVFSANKLKELLTDERKSNFNTLLCYELTAAKIAANPPTPSLRKGGVVSPPYGGWVGVVAKNTIGYCIAYTNSDILHYCYPFYALQATSYQLPANLGLGMMLKAILWAKESGKKYVYLGSFSRPTDTYKLQFAGLEWWDKNSWQTDIHLLKNQFSV